MINLKDIAQASSVLCADVLQGAQRLIAPDKTDPATLTEDETEAIVICALATAALLEGTAIASLPPEKARVVRAFTERLAHEIQVVRNGSASTVGADRIVVVPERSPNAGQH